MDWIYLSPHLDDIALSCGGLVWEQANSGDRLEIWSICAGDPPDGPISQFAEGLHKRWKTGRLSTEQRRNEDIQACTSLKASYRHFAIPDCIYRRSPEDGHLLYTSEEAIFGPVDSAELPLILDIRENLERLLPEEAVLVSPLAIGGHVDHRLVRSAAEMLENPLWYYADYPYVEREGGEICSYLPFNYERCIFQVSEQGMRAWFEAVAAHRSQISSFWPDNASMEADLEKYYSKQGGITLWKPAGVKG